MPAAPLTYHGLASGRGDGNSPRLQVATPNGTIREIPLERRDVMRILKAAVATLEHLDDEQRRDERAARLLPKEVHEADLMDDETACGLPRQAVEWTSVTTRTTCRACIAKRST